MSHLEESRFAAGPPQGETTPSGGRERSERGGQGFAAGPPLGETAPLGGSADSEAGKRGGFCFVLDTNIVLDLWVFSDPATEPLRAAIQTPGTQVVATPVMRDELERVLAYPHLVRRQALDGQAAAAVLQAWDATVTLQPVAPKARFTCTDQDDQKFIDLAAACATQLATQGNGIPRTPVVLLSKDKAVLRLKKRLSTLGVTVAKAWLPAATPVPHTSL